MIRLEDMLLFVGGHAAAVVGNRQNSLMLAWNHAIGKQDAPGRADRIKGVANQVFQNLAQMRRVAVKRLGIALHDGKRASGGRRGTLNNLLKQAAYIAKLGHEDNLLGIGARTFNQLAKVGDRAFDDFGFMAFGRIRTDG